MGAHRHQAGLGHGAGAVVHRGVRHLHARERRDHRLVFINRLQRALTGFRLIGGIGAVELAARDDRPDGRRNMMFVRTGTNKIERQTILVRALLHQLHDLQLVHAFRDALQRAHAQGRRNFIEQRFDIARADGGEHLLNISVGMRYEWHGALSSRRHCRIGLGI